MSLKKSFQAESSPIVVTLEDGDVVPPIFSEDGDSQKKEEEQPIPETQTHGEIEFSKQL